MWIIYYCFLSLVFLTVLNGHIENRRQKRYLVFTPSTQWGVFVTISIPIHPEATVSAAWFIEANYYIIDNATWLEPLLGDFDINGRKLRSNSPPLFPRADDKNAKNVFTRSYIYAFIESMLEKHGYPGRDCLLLSICENASAMFRHNGVVGDLLHLILTPSTSIEEEIDDSFYEAEYYGMQEDCEQYGQQCPESPLDLLSVHIENAL